MQRWNRSLFDAFFLSTRRTCFLAFFFFSCTSVSAEDCVKPGGEIAEAGTESRNANAAAAATYLISSS